MKTIDKIYINGQFVTPHGAEVMNLISPSTKETIGTVTLGDKSDVQNAIAAAKKAFGTFSRSTVEERIGILERLHISVRKRYDELVAAMVEEYGAPIAIARQLTEIATNDFPNMVKILRSFDFVQQVDKAKVHFEPLGVVAAITPWNANYINIAGKISPAIAAGCTIVIKPSELSAIQTQIMAECIHEANVPAGVVNIVNGTGEVVGHELSIHPDVAKIAFTGSTRTGKQLRHNAVDTMKRITLELGGKSPNIIFDDADFNKAIPLALMACFINSGQACLAGTRLLVPEHRLDEVKQLIKASIGMFKSGNPNEADTLIGPMVNETQYNRVQRYIQSGIDEGAEVVAGGLGHPEGHTNGYYVQPTVFAHVNPDMTITREEIFGPVLSIITYKTEEEAVRIANDTIYGLQAYISTPDLAKANRVAAQLQAGTIYINGLHDQGNAPFGGFKQSGIGREFGTFGLREYLEPKTVMGYDSPEINIG